MVFLSSDVIVTCSFPSVAFYSKETATESVKTMHGSAWRVLLLITANIQKVAGVSMNHNHFRGPCILLCCSTFQDSHLWPTFAFSDRFGLRRSAANDPNSSAKQGSGGRRQHERFFSCFSRKEEERKEERKDRPRSRPFSITLSYLARCAKDALSLALSAHAGVCFFLSCFFFFFSFSLDAIRSNRIHIFLFK